jgi:two-component system sensor kinase FixL
MRPGSVLPLPPQPVSPGTVEGLSTDGVRQLQAQAAIASAPGWQLVYGEELAQIQAEIRQPLLSRLAGAVAAVAGGLVLAAILGGRLAHTLQVLTSQAGTVTGGTDCSPTWLPHSSVTEFEALRQGMIRADAVLRRRSAAERMALREARTGHELLISVVNATAECIYVKDLDLRYVLVNRAALASWPEPHEEWQVLGRTSAELFPSGVAHRIEQADRTVLATGRMTSFEQDYVLESSKAGNVPQTRWLWMTVTPWQDAAGRVVGVVSVSRDITDQRAAGTRLRAMQADMLRATRLSAMGAMASGLAHELNQPLAAATNYLNAGGRLFDRGSGDPAALQSARSAVSDAAQQLLRAGAIVRRLRDFVGRGEAELQPEDIGDLIREARDLAQADGITGGVTLRLDIVAARAIVLVDRTQIQQVLLNLIRNAAEAIGGMEASHAGEITLTAIGRPGDGMCIEVTDNGPGLAPEIAERLFQPFVSTKPTGMGIGLAICHTIVQGHGGRLSAERLENGGTRFRIALPSLLPPGAHA